MKKFLLIIMILTILAGLGWWLWSWRSGAGPSLVNNQNNVSTQSVENFFPGGAPVQSGGEVSGGDGNTMPTATSSGGITTPVRSGLLTRISTRPVAGVFALGTGTSSRLTYIERAAGRLYQVSADGQNSVQLSDTTIPKVYEAWGGVVGTTTRVIARYLKEGQPQIFAGQLVVSNFPTSSELTGQLSGEMWDTAIHDLAIAPDQKQLFYLETRDGESSGWLSDFDQKKKTQIFSSPLQEWRTGWPAPNTIALQTRASALAPGWLYWLDWKSKTLTKVIGEVPGLTTLTSPDLKQVLYSGLTPNGLAFGLYQVASGLFERLPLQTIADKCIWTKDGGTVYCGVPQTLPADNYPDSWYRGEVSSRDSIWKINARNHEAQVFFNPTLTAGINLDVSDPQLSGDGQTLFFLNHRDLSLWALDLSEGF